MSEGPELPGAELTGLEALAAEHALGVLNGRERAEAEARAARDPAFAALVDEWRLRLAPLADEVAEVTPPAGAWRAVERRLPANDNAAAARRLRFWRGATVGALGLAAASLAVAVLLAGRPPVVLTPAPAAAPGPMLNASLMPNQGVQPLFVAAYDPMRKMLVVTSLVPPGTDPAHVHQLWVVPADGKPHSLGMIEPGKSKAMPMPAPMAPMLAPGARLMVSVEPPGGSRTEDAPSGPVAAEGRLSTI